jgi:hypothetical protein
VFVESRRAHAVGIWKAPDENDSETPIRFEARFDVPELSEREAIQSLLLNALGERQTATLNGRELYRDAPPRRARTEIAYAELRLKPQGNVLLIQATPFEKSHGRSSLRSLQPAALFIRRQPPACTRKVFNGWAQAIVQVGDERGTLTIAASSEGLQSASVPLAVY